MKYLLDTNILIWYIEENNQLPLNIKDLIDNEENECYISVVTLWEISLKKSIGKLKLPVTLNDFFYDIEYEYRINIMPLKNHHILYSSNLTFLHKDPFDRMIFSVAQSEKIEFLFTDKIFNKYNKGTFKDYEKP